MKEIPSRIQTQLLDRISTFGDDSDYLAVQLELVFSKQLDVDRLSRALDLSIEVEPVLGCRFVAHWRRPYWEMVDSTEREIFIFTEAESEYMLFKISPFNTCDGPQLKACLWRSSNGDRLLLKVTDVVADAGGVKEIAGRISNIYTRLEVEPGYQPMPNLDGSRSYWQVLRHIPWYEFVKNSMSFLRDIFSVVIQPSSLTLPISHGPHTPLAFISRHLSVDQTSRLSEYGRAHDATINDLMLAAFFRALVAEGDWNGEDQLRLSTTIDLRRYLSSGCGERIAKLSALTFSWPCLDTDLGKDFDTTLMRVAALTRRRKADWLGVSDSLFFCFFQPLPYNWGKKLFNLMIQGRAQQPCLTNMGPINPDSVNFGIQPLSAWLLPPPFYPPDFIAGLSGYAGTLTLSAGVFPTQKSVVENFFDSVVSILPL